MAERSILSYFATSRQALGAEKILKELGYKTLQIDRVSSYPTGLPDPTMHNPVSGQIRSQSNLVLGAELGDDAALLASADPSVSGMSANYMPGNYSFLLTVVTEDERVKQAVAVIKKHGGFV